uniref:Putative site-specific DNA endonuclease n=1 Tax=Schizomeris leibleinii TaxID=104533 RepID=F8SY82_9CHLO|nr:Putative site-specific DNA endonuclease [Schizomeris leibleinii]AEH05419.1 Putative site-specific DNA endonuclease [Schizomeris leibleinii]
MNLNKTNKNFFDRSLKSGVYVITCLPLGKHYIGVSTHVVRRLNAHKTALRNSLHSNKELQKDFLKYGEKNFLFQKLYMGAGLEKKQLEEFETQILLTLPSDKRYNIYTNWRVKGSGTNPFYGRKHTQEARKAMSFANKNRPSSFLGRTQSNAVKKLISQQNKGNTNKERRKPLYIDSVFYESISHASQITGLSRRLIRDRCHSDEPRFANYQWEIKDSPNQPS